MTTSPLFQSARERRSARLKQRREDRREVIGQDDPRIKRLTEIRRAIPALTREARALSSEIRKCRFLPATCQHCKATWDATSIPRLRCPSCKARDWLKIPAAYAEAARNPLDLDVTGHAPATPINTQPAIDEIARELGLDPPPRMSDDLAMPLAEFREKYVDPAFAAALDAPPLTPEQEIEAAWDKVNRVHSSPDELVDPLNLPAPEPIKLPGRSQADVEADWQRELAKDRPLVTTTLIEDPLTAPSEPDSGADYYLLVRILTEKGLA